MFRARFVEFWRRFLNAINIILCHYYHSLWKGKVLNLNKLESSLPRFSSYWPNGSGEDFKTSSTYLFYANITPPLGKGCYHLIFERTLKSCLPKDYLCLVWVGLTKWFWRRFFKVVSFNVALGKGRVFSFEQIWIIFTWMFCAEFS